MLPKDTIEVEKESPYCEISDTGIIFKRERTLKIIIDK